MGDGVVAWNGKKLNLHHSSVDELRGYLTHAEFSVYEALRFREQVQDELATRQPLRGTGGV